MTLAIFNTKQVIDTFNQYLQYYLNRPQLHFDQGTVITALKYLDEVNGTDHHTKHLQNWINFLSYRDEEQIRNLENLKKMVPDKIEEIDIQIAELEPEDHSIDIGYFHESVLSRNRIIEG